MKKMKQTEKQKLGRLRKALRKIVAYPPEGHDLRTDDGYPTELRYDEFAYKQMVDSFRDAIKAAIAGKPSD